MTSLPILEPREIVIPPFQLGQVSVLEQTILCLAIHIQLGTGFG